MSTLASPVSSWPIQRSLSIHGMWLSSGAQIPLISTGFNSTKNKIKCSMRETANKAVNSSFKGLGQYGGFRLRTRMTPEFSWPHTHFQSTCPPPTFLCTRFGAALSFLDKLILLVFGPQTTFSPYRRDEKEWQLNVRIPREGRGGQMLLPSRGKHHDPCCGCHPCGSREPLHTAQKPANERSNCNDVTPMTSGVGVAD